MSKDRGREELAMNEGREKSRREIEEAFRQRRKPLGGHRQKLKTDKIPGYHLHWFNDEGNRLEEALNAGYQFVSQEYTPIGVGEGLDGNTDMGTFISKATDWDNGTRSYLMAIRQEWWEEDQEAEKADIKRRKDALRQGKSAPGGDPGRMYIPTSGIKII